MGRIPAHDHERLRPQLLNEGGTDSVHVAMMVGDRHIDGPAARATALSISLQGDLP